MKITREQLEKLGVCEEFCNALENDWAWPVESSSSVFTVVSLKRALGEDMVVVRRFINELSHELHEAWGRVNHGKLTEAFSDSVLRESSGYFFDQVLQLIEITPGCPEHKILCPAPIPEELRFKRGDHLASASSGAHYLVLRDTYMTEEDICLDLLCLVEKKLSFGGRCTYEVGDSFTAFWNNSGGTWSCLTADQNPMFSGGASNFLVKGRLLLDE